MKNILKIMLLTSLLFGNVYAAGTCPVNAPYFCVTPEMASNSEIKLTDFYQIPAVIISIFHTPISLDAQWDSPYLGMGMKDSKNMLILGGTTRAKGMTKDAYAAAVCHELGHVLGGAPYQTIKGSEWASSEGQADFFAASVCLPEYFKKLGLKYSEISARIEKAGYEMLSSLAPHSSQTSEELKTLYRFQPIYERVEETLINNYPSLQCRYEIFRNPIERSDCWFNQ
jgi:hypothetical protein